MRASVYKNNGQREPFRVSIGLAFIDMILQLRWGGSSGWWGMVAGAILKVQQTMTRATAINSLAVVMATAGVTFVL